MDRENVASSNIDSIGYDEPAETLEIAFHGGMIYQYFNVGRALHEQLMQASSKGQFFNTYIKDIYPFSRVA